MQPQSKAYGARAYITGNNWDYYERHCKGKIKHQSAESANAHIADLAKNRSGIEYDWYECNFCSLENNRKFHVGERKSVLYMELQGRKCVCGICGVGQSSSETSQVRFKVDRGKDWKVRGILCEPCYSGVVMFKGSAVNLIKAIEYLRVRQRV
jgi:hypothetical protein